MSNPIPNPIRDSQSNPTAFDRFYDHGKRAKDAIDLAIEDASHSRNWDHYEALVRYRNQYRAMAEAIDQAAREGDTLSGGSARLLRRAHAAAALDF